MSQNSVLLKTIRLGRCVCKLLKFAKNADLAKFSDAEMRPFQASGTKFGPLMGVSQILEFFKLLYSVTCAISLLEIRQTDLSSIEKFRKNKI